MDHAQDGLRQEWVLLVPPKLTKSSFKLLKDYDCVARPWHLSGRHGSRTHPHSDGRMAIPILSKEVVRVKSEDIEELQELLCTTGVEMTEKDYFTSNRHSEPPPFNATIHVEQAPPNYKVPSRAEVQSTYESPQHTAFTFAELFAGIGGFGVALEALGGKCVFVSELEATCRQVYSANLTVDEKVVFGDIYEVQDSQFPTSVDLLVAGFPCQPFSTLGQQPGLECVKAGNLFLEIVRFLNVSKPKAFLLENVPGLLGMKETLEVIVTALQDCGYAVTFEVLDARGLTATSRKRLYIVGLRETEGEPSLFEFPFVPDLCLRARDVVDFDNDDDILRVSDDQLERLCEQKYWKPAHLAWPNTTVKTLVLHYGNSISRGGSQLVPCESGNPRRFSARECASIMGFPRNFQLPTRQAGQGDMAFLKRQYQMFGNAVCPPMIAVLAGAVLDKCPEIYGNEFHKDWVEFGRTTAIRLAYEATLMSIFDETQCQ